MNITQSDRAAIRSVVERQLAAFQRDDAVGAFAFASLEIQAQFLTAANFMQMVKRSYPVLYRPRSVIFEELTTLQGSLAQPVLLLDAQENLLKALYLMEKHPDGHWRIQGCYLQPLHQPQD